MLNIILKKWGGEYHFSKEPTLILKVSVILIIAFCFLFNIYGDYLSTTEQGVMLIEATLKGQFFDYYRYSLEHKTLYWAPTYEIPIYIIFAIWNFPIFLVNYFAPFNYVGNIYSIMWAKLLMLVFTVYSAFIIKEICTILRINKSSIEWAFWFYLSFSIVMMSSVWLSQVDIISSFFALLGFKAYLKKDMKKFILWFAVAIPIKLFALFIFLPLVLLIEKKVLNIIFYYVSGMSLWVISKLLFYNNEGYTLAMSKFSEETFNRLFVAGMKLGLSEVSFFIFVYIAVAIFAYLQKPSSEDTFNRLAIYLPLVVYYPFIIFVFIHPYWVIVLAPYIIFTLFINPRLFKINILLQSIMWTMFTFTVCKVIWWVFTHSTVHMGILGSIGIEYSSFRLSEVFSGIPIGVVYTVFIVCAIAFLILNYPYRKCMVRADGSEDTISIEKGYVWYHIMLFPVFALLMVYLYLAPGRATLYSTLDINNPYAITEGVSLSEPVAGYFVSPYNAHDVKLSWIYYINPLLYAGDYDELVITLFRDGEEKPLTSIRYPMNMLKNLAELSIPLKDIIINKDVKYKVVLSSSKERVVVAVGMSENTTSGSKEPAIKVTGKIIKD